MFGFRKNKLVVLVYVIFLLGSFVSSLLQEASFQQKNSRLVGRLSSSKSSDIRVKNKPSNVKVSPTHRSTAIFALLEASKKSNQFAVRYLENDPGYLSLDQRDRSFSRLLLTVTERRLGQIDRIIDGFQKKKKKIARPQDRLAQATLRVGAAQLLFLEDVPVYAVLKETVEVLRMHPKIKVQQPQINFVNAILREIDRKGEMELAKTSVLDNVEPWLIKEWIGTYGKERTKAIVEASMKQSPIFLTVNHDHSANEEERKAKISGLVKQFDERDEGKTTVMPQGSIKVPSSLSGFVSSWPSYDEGEWWVQDVSATLPAIALCSTMKTLNFRNEDLHVVDLCSAPGGKTAQLCSAGFGKVTAVEISKARTRQLKSNLKRLKLESACEVAVADGREWAPDNEERVDAILVDAPCSATGVGSRRPDVLRKSPDIDELTSMQRELAVHAVDNLLKPGGIMIYATCSLLHQESEDQMSWLLSRNDGASIENIPLLPGEIPGFDSCIDENGWLRVLPGSLSDSFGACDGFFVARIRRL